MNGVPCLSSISLERLTSDLQRSYTFLLSSEVLGQNALCIFAKSQPQLEWDIPKAYTLKPLSMRGRKSSSALKLVLPRIPSSHYPADTRLGEEQMAGRRRGLSTLNPPDLGRSCTESI